MTSSGIDVSIKLSGVAVAFNNEAFTDSGDLTTFEITDATKQVWDPTAAVTIETSTDAGATWNAADPTTYSLDRLFGKVTFNAQQAAGTTVQASGKYLPMTVVAEAHGWTDTGTLATADVTPFGSKSKQFKPLELDMSGQLNDFGILDTFYLDTLVAGTTVVLEFDDGTETTRYWALLNKDEVKGATGSTFDGTVSWQGTQDADGRVMSNE